MNVIEIFEQLEATSSRLEKEAILREHKGQTYLQEAFKAALDPYRTYGVSKIAKPTKHRDDSSLANLTIWLTLLDRLQNRVFVGNEAKARIKEALEICSELEQKWFERILVKNLRCGVTETTVNKIWPDLIPKFEVQLAEEIKVEFKDEAFVQTAGKPIEFPIYVDPKLDGLRMVAIKQNGVVTLFSRGGKEFETFPTIKTALEKADYDNTVLDGEVMAHGKGEEAWNHSASVAHSTKSVKSDEAMVYNVFDIMTLDEWVKQDCKTLFKDRFLRVEELANLVANPSVKPVSGAIVKDFSDLVAFYEECLEASFEGCMLKKLEARYEFKRSSSVSKFKPVCDWSGKVVGVYGGHKGGKWEGKFGGLLVRLPNGKDTQVGGGYSDELRAELLTSGESLIGKFVDVVGQPPLSKWGKIRFPRFKRFRDASDVDASVRDIEI
jgi:ATP-dependent DNA ligase